MGKSSNFKPGIFQLWQSWLWKIIWFHCSVEIGDAHLLDCFTKTMCSINGLVHRKTYGKPCCSRLFVDQPNDLRWKKWKKHIGLLILLLLVSTGSARWSVGWIFDVGRLLILLGLPAAAVGPRWVLRKGAGTKKKLGTPKSIMSFSIQDI